MMKNITKKEARELLGARSDAHLARMIGMVKSRMSMFRDDEPVTDGVQWRVRAVLAESALADISASPTAKDSSTP